MTTNFVAPAATGPTSSHLAYCTNVHAGESLAEVRAALEQYLPAVKSLTSPNTPMGVGLRLSAAAAATLYENAESVEDLRDFLKANGLYVFTVNGFPYGHFHGAPVKAGVYEPDWRTPERLAYTNCLADLLVALMPADQPGLTGSISTVPGGFRPLARAPGAVEAVRGMLLRAAAHLDRLRNHTGRTIALALEPEPMCLVETSAETVLLFESELFSHAAIGEFACLAGLSRPLAETALRRHLGVCLDACHAAVEFEDAAECVDHLRQSGIAIAKLQLSSAIRIPSINAEAIAHLRHFNDGIYLHQVVERRSDGRLVRYLDLPDAITAFEQDPAGGVREWRVHCHVPVFQDRLVGLDTTQAFLVDLLALHRRDPISPHLEVETYTWDVLPHELRRPSLAEAIGREMAWVQDRLRF